MHAVRTYEVCALESSSYEVHLTQAYSVLYYKISFVGNINIIIQVHKKF